MHAVVQKYGTQFLLTTILQFASSASRMWRSVIVCTKIISQCQSNYTRSGLYDKMKSRMGPLLVFFAGFTICHAQLVSDFGGLFPSSKKRVQDTVSWHSLELALIRRTKDSTLLSYACEICPICHAFLLDVTGEWSIRHFYQSSQKNHNNRCSEGTSGHHIFTAHSANPTGGGTARVGPLHRLCPNGRCHRQVTQVGTEKTPPGLWNFGSNARVPYYRWK